MIKLLLLLIVIILASCVSQLDNDLEFDVGVGEMTASIVKFRQSENNFLFVFLVDREGVVRKSKFIETKYKGVSRRKIRDIELFFVRNFKYSKAVDTDDDYRTIFHATNYVESMSPF